MAKVNMKETMDKQIDKAKFLLIQRKSKSIKCRCFDELHQTGDSNCNICLGEGLLYQVKRVKAIQQKKNFAATTENKSTNLGSIEQSKFNFFMKSNITPKGNDKIFLASFKDQVPVNLQYVLNIDIVTPIINDTGEVILYEVVASNSPKNYTIGKAVVKKSSQVLSEGRDGFYVRPI